MAESKTSETKAEATEKADAGVATEKQNAALEHTQSGATTRDDGTDAGVPMLPGDASEPQGPEDAFGEGEKRGDYRERGDNSTHFESVPIPEDERAEDGSGPVSKLIRQDTRTEDIGDATGLKGGVDTDLRT